MTRTCRYQPCSKAFEPSHPRQEFCEPTCRANQHYLEHPEKGRVFQRGALRSVATHPLSDARARQESSELKSKLSQIIYQGIVDRLKFGPVHADDLEPLFAEGVRDTCRKLVGAQFGSLASRGYIREKERRKSKVPSRKGAKSGVFEFTRKGQEKLVGDSSGNGASSQDATPVSGEKSAPGASGPPRQSGATSSPSPSPGTDNGSREGSSSLPSPSGEPARLFDLSQARERPRSAFADPEAA